jgi:hypothetical protein
MRPADATDLVALWKGQGEVWHVTDAGKIHYNADPSGVDDTVSCEGCGTIWHICNLRTVDIAREFVVGNPPTKPGESISKIYYNEEFHCLMTRPLTPEEVEEVRQREMQEAADRTFGNV